MLPPLWVGLIPNLDFFNQNEKTGYASPTMILRQFLTGNLGLHHIDHIKMLDIQEGRTPELISKEIVKKILSTES